MKRPIKIARFGDQEMQLRFQLIEQKALSADPNEDIEAYALKLGKMNFQGLLDEAKSIGAEVLMENTESK